MAVPPVIGELDDDPDIVFHGGVDRARAEQVAAEQMHHLRACFHDEIRKRRSKFGMVITPPKGVGVSAAVKGDPPDPYGVDHRVTGAQIGMRGIVGLDAKDRHLVAACGHCARGSFRTALSSAELFRWVAVYGHHDAHRCTPPWYGLVVQVCTACVS